MRPKRLSRRSWLRWASLGGAFTAVAACGRVDRPLRRPLGRAKEAQSIPRGGIISLAISGTPPGLDPHLRLHHLTQRLAAFTYSRLFKFQTGPGVNAALMEVEPDLAERVERAPDGLSYVVQLRPNVRFQNRPPVYGREVTAQDVALSISRYRTFIGPSSTQLAVMERIETLDAQTLRFVLKQPYEPFLSALASPTGLWVLPGLETVERVIDPEHEQGVIGSGPFVLEGYRPGEVVRLRRNPDYFLADLPYVDGFDLFIEPDYAHTKVRFQNRSLDIFRPYALDVLDVRRATPNVQLFGEIPIGMNFLYFGSEGTKNPFAFDVRLRRALSLALHREALAETYGNVSQLRLAGLASETRYHNVAVPAAFERWWLNPLSPKMGGASRWYRFNPREARALLAAAGFPDGLEVPFHYPRNGYGTAFTSIARTVAEMLTEVGIRMKIEPENYTRYSSETALGRFSGIAFGPATIYTEVDDWLTSLLYSSSPRNPGRIKDKQVDRLIERQQQATSEAERRQVLWDLQRYLSEQMYYVPSTSASAWTAVQPWVQNYGSYHVNSGSYGQPTEHWLWLYIATP